MVLRHRVLPRDPLARDDDGEAGSDPLADILAT
jgi:hypothetical protein